METAIKKATRLDHIPPKQKHLDTLVSLTNQSPGKIGRIMHALEKRAHESSWIIVFKAFVVLHTLMRESTSDCVVDYAYRHSHIFLTSQLRNTTSNYIQAHNIKVYKGYLLERTKAYGGLKCDPVKLSYTGSLRRESPSPMLFNKIKAIQLHIASILSARFTHDGVEGTICLCAFRLMVKDLIDSFKAQNDGIMNILEHYFTMGKSDAKVSLAIYQVFAIQTEETVSYLRNAKILQTSMSFTIPEVKHAPLSLVTALEEYLNDPKFKTTEAPLRTLSTSDVELASPQPLQPPKLDSVDFFARPESEHVFMPATSAANTTFSTSVPPSTPALATPTYVRNFNNPFRASMLAFSSPPVSVPAAHMTARYSTFLAQSMPNLTVEPAPSNSNPFRASISTQPITHTSPHNPFAPNPPLSVSTLFTNQTNPHAF